jgi:endoglucanase
VIYNFHFYEPSLFTYQGAAWSQNAAVRPLRMVPYPSSPQAVKPLVDSIDDPAIKADLQDYGNQRWDAAKIEQTLQQAADWGKRYHVRVICDEFGAYKMYANPQDRQAWVSDVRTSLEKLGIGWSMWEYDGGFGLVQRTGDFTQNPSIVVDIPLTQSLGLTENQSNP